MLNSKDKIQNQQAMQELERKNKQVAAQEQRLQDVEHALSSM